MVRLVGLRLPSLPLLRFIGTTLLAWCVFFHAPWDPVAAQAAYGGLRGVVSDESGAALPDAVVTITSLERQARDVLVTNEAGAFVDERLLPGLYEVRVERSDFQSAVAPSLMVAVGAQVTADFILSAGTFSEWIEVRSSAQQLKTDRADVATRFDARALTDLPVADRNPAKLMLLTPGALRNVWQHASSENPQGSFQVQINGQQFGQTGYLLDGVDNRDPMLGILVVNPSAEAIAEFTVTSQNYDAELGQALGGIVSVLTRSGSNRRHGSLFEFYQSDRFQARNPFTQFQPDPATGKRVPPSRRHHFGGSLGGPILENRWFFFGDYQGRQQRQGGSRLLSVPTASARRGDLSAYAVDIFDPATGEAFPNGVIPSSRLSNQALALLAKVPLPNAAGRDNGTRDNFVSSGAEMFAEHSFNVRLDAHLADRLNVFGRYSLGDFAIHGGSAFGEGGGPQFVSLGGRSEVRNQNLALGLDYASSSRTAADVRFGWFRYHVAVLPSDYGTTPARDAGIPGLNLDTTWTSGMPGIFVDGDRGFTMGTGLEISRCNCPLDQDETQWQLLGNVTRLWGSHTVKAGADVRHAVNLRVPSDFHRSGELWFGPSRTASPELGGGLGLATFLLGDVTRFGRFASAVTDARERQWRHFYYAQDTWRAHRRVTLAYGLRLDVINPQTVNGAGQGGWLDLSTGNILVGGVGGVDLAGNVRNTWNWAPRAAMTFVVNDRTVVRGGFGRTYDVGVFGSTFGHTVTQSLPVLLIQQLNPASDYDRVFSLAQGPPAPAYPRVPPTGTLPLPNGVLTYAVPRKQRVPSADAWNVTLQHQLNPTWSFELGYVGNRGVHAYVGDSAQQPVNQPALDGFLDGVPRDVRRPFFAGGVRPNVLGLGGFFGWTQDIGFYANRGESSYQALQTRVVRRLAEGSSLQANYSLQRVEQQHDDYWIYEPDLNRGPADFDRTHVVNVLGFFELPVGRDRRFGNRWPRLGQALLGGWQLNGVLTLQSGTPFNVTYRNAFQDRDTGPNRPHLIGDATGPQTRAQWFNATAIGLTGSAFSRPAAGTFGDLPYGALRGPGFWQLDASLLKTVLFTGYRLELRVEAVNVLNNVNLGNPDAEIGVMDNPNPNAGRISNTAFGGTAPQRNLQFGVRLLF